MAWTIPNHTRADVDRAGKTLIDPKASWPDRWNAWQVADNWRSSHAYPLNHFQDMLRRKTRKVDQNGVVVQRQKRRHSIELKLRDNPAMQLSQMQDLGGCRAIVSDVDRVMELVREFEMSRTKAELVRKYDYIAKPRPSGYRGVHLVYRYKSDYAVTEPYNGLRIEIQLRTQMQHAWATAVEVAGAFRNEALKSSHGSEDWLRFFQLMGSEIARAEKCPLVEGTPNDSSILIAELRQCAIELNVDQLLSGWTGSIELIQQRPIAKAHYYVLVLDTVQRTLRVTGYPQTKLADAQAERVRLESEHAANPSVDVVLVSANHIDEITKGYPNYRLDTSAFIDELRSAIEFDEFKIEELLGD